MGRKKTLPQQMGDEQRREVEWNMLDNAVTATTSASQSTLAPDPAPAPGSLTIIGDNDPTLEQELEAAEEEMEWETGRRALNGSVHRPRTQATTSVPVLNSHGLGAEKIRDIVPESVQQFFRRSEIRAQLEELLRWSAGVPAYSKDHPYSQQLKSEWHWEVGKFSVQLLDHDALPVDPLCHLSHIQQCMLYFAFNDNNSHIIYYEVYDKKMAEESQGQIVEKRKNNIRFSQRQKAVVQDHLGLYWYIRTECSDAWSLFQNLKQSGKKKFQLMFGDFDSTGRQLEVTLYGLKDSLQKLAHPSQGFPLRPVNYVLLSAMDHFYKLGPWPKTDCTNSKHDFQELYRGMKSLQNSQKFTLDIDVQHPSLKPRLRPYQQDAVRWMLKQERFGEEDKSDLTEGDDLHPMYAEVVSGCGKTLYYNRQGGSIVLERPTKVVSPPGGILADEMGLGKTVEVLCCMLLHPRPPFPQPARLPTLMEMELDPEEEDSDSTWTPVSGTNSSVLGADQAGDTKPTDIPLKRVDSESSSLSSVPSEVVSYEVTGDHSYISSMPASSMPANGGGAPSVAALGQMASPQPGGAAASDVAGEPGEEFKSPLKLEFGKDLTEESTGRSADKAQSDAGSESQPRCEEQPARSGKKKKKSPAASKGKKRKLQPGAGEKKRKSPTKAPDQENGAGSGTPIKEKKRMRLSRYFKYIPDDEYQQFMTPNPLIVPKKQLFECVCGKGETETVRTARSSRRQKHVVMCTVCGTSQHAECMHYDLEDPFRGPYKCPHCHYNGDPIPSGATLIVSPFSISHQWTDEIKKHIREKTIKVFVYTGVANQGFMQPQMLASQDIVITTYETLRRELNYVNLPHTNSDMGRRFRNPKKFMAKPTPLTAVEWWRICLDEAQMVECVTTKTADMALRLSCVNRWCVTGTPLNQSISDLFGLLAFIAFDPYCVEEWWRRWLWNPYCCGIKDLLHQVLAKVMWRNSMEEVKHQLALPDQTEEIYHLTFSPVEDLFYRRLYHKCAEEITRFTLQLSSEERSERLSNFDPATVAKLFRPLVKLRQACCHPQAVKGSFIAVQESMMTMEQLLENLIKKTVTECMESHRNMIAAMNGQAGIHLIEDPPKVPEAVALYREVLMSVEEHEKRKQFQTDTLPHLHTLHNLKEVLATRPPGVHPTLRDDQLGKQCDELKEKYLLRASNAVAITRDQLAPCKQAVQDLTQQLGDRTDWYVEVLSHASQAGHAVELVRKAQQDVSSASFNRSFRNIAGLQYIIATDLLDLQQARHKVLTEMKRIDKIDVHDKTILEQAIPCCLRPVNNIELKTCVFCKLSDVFENLESKLFDISIEQRVIGGEDISYRKGTWKDGSLEVILKSVHSFARNQLLSWDAIQDGTVHIQLFEAWKKEFRQLRALWVKLREEMAAVDELEMAVTRMRLRLPGEAAPGQWDVHVREKPELESLLKKFVMDQKVYASELKTKCGQLEYLKNLAKAKQGEFRDGVNPDQCPICKEELGRNWSVLLCGHCFCMTCIQLVIENSSRGLHPAASVSLKCAVCREKTKTGEISYVSTTRSTADDSSPAVKGSHSTKVAAIVQQILNIQRDDSSAKVLIFASWIDVLKLIAKALEENDIRYTHLYEHGKKFERNVTCFKEDGRVAVLLLPYNSGSNGLNLFEASHVILVEPILSPAQEAQAIGRVYRMGQTRHTKVHRFLVKNTIEERIHKLMESTLRPAAYASGATKDTTPMTVNQLVSLFEDPAEEKGEDEAGSQHHEVSMNLGHAGRADADEDAALLGGASSGRVEGPCGLPSSSVAGPCGLPSGSVAGAPVSIAGRAVSTPLGGVRGPSVMSSSSVAGPSGDTSRSVAGPRGVSLASVAGPSGVSSSSVAGPSGVSLASVAGPSGVSLSSVAGPSGMSSSSVAGPSGMSSCKLLE